MALEPVNERPIFPQLIRADALGVSGWSTSMVRQLTTVFQQYGYRINKGLTVEDLGSGGGNVPELDALNNFAQMMQVGGEPLIQMDSNADGDWITFAGMFAVCWRVVTPDWTNASFQSWATPITFASVPAQLTSMATHTAGGAGNAAIDIVEGVANSPTTTNFRIAFRGSTSATAAGEQVTIMAIGVPA